MELTASNVIKSLSEIAPYIEADGGFVEFVEIEEETKFVGELMTAPALWWHISYFAHLFCRQLRSPTSRRT